MNRARSVATVGFAHTATTRDGDSRVRCTLERLQSLTRGALMKFSLEVGRIVIETLYDGDSTAWRDRGHKSSTLRALAASPELPISVSALYRALAIYELNASIGRDVESWQNIGISHVRVVLGLERQQQLNLLDAASEKNWTVSKLEKEAARYRSVVRTRGGRRATPRYVKTIRRIHDLTSPESLEGLDAWSCLHQAELEELAKKLAEARERLAILASVLPRRSTPPSLNRAKDD